MMLLSLLIVTQNYSPVKNLFLGIIIVATVVLTLVVSHFYLRSNQLLPQQDFQNTSTTVIGIQPLVLEVNTADDLEKLEGADTVIIWSLKNLSQVFRSIVIDQPLTYEAVMLESCEYFTVLNSKTYSIEDWIYRWIFPALKVLTLKNIDINRHN
ncbi:unnamed protein product, partial [Allacma fusca]